MRLKPWMLAALGLALAACDGGNEASEEKIDPTTSGTGAGHLGVAPNEEVEQPPPAQ